MLVDILAAQTDVITAQQDLDALFENHAVDRAEALMDKLEAERNLETAINVKVNKEQGRGDRSDLERAQGNYGVAQAKLEEAERRYYLAADRPPSDPGRAALMDQITSAIQEREQALAELNYYLLGPDPLELDKSDADIAYYTAELEKAEEDWRKLQDGPDPDDVSLAEAKVSSAKLKFESLQKDVEDIEMVAPFDGTVVVNNLKEGEMVKSGDVMVKLADLTKWRVETTDLTELDIVDIRKGSSVKVTFDALPDLEIPGLITEVKQLGVNLQGDITYTVKIDLLEQSDCLRWNMTATVIFE
jgi:HlyD family secretion protein